MKSNTSFDDLTNAAIKMLREDQPAIPPLLFPLSRLTDYINARHITLMREAGFPDARRAFNSVFAHLPADGARLTELAKNAGMTKQSMGELVDELVRLGYLVRFADPEDRRAKIVLRAERGLQAHIVSMKIFAQIDDELGELLGKVRFEDLRMELLVLEGAAIPRNEPASAAEGPSGGQGD